MSSTAEPQLSESKPEQNRDLEESRQNKSMFASGRFGQKVQGKPSHSEKDIPNKPKRNSPYVQFFAIIAGIHVPWLMFGGIILLYMFLYHTFPLIIWFGVLVGFVIFAVGGMMCWQRGASQMMMICFLCCLAFPLGGLSGLYNYQKNLMGFWSVINYQEYTNVAPDEDAASHQDAGIIVFSKDSTVDITRSTAFTSGTEYCVAPIVSNHIQMSTIEYWAVGKDCCNSRSGFMCDDASLPLARAGIVVHNVSATFFRDGDFYTGAVKMAEQNYGLTAGKKILFVRWFHDIDDGMKEYMTDAFHLWFWQILGFYFMFLGFGAFLFLGGLDVLDALDGKKEDAKKPIWCERGDNDYGSA